MRRFAAGEIGAPGACAGRRSCWAGVLTAMGYTASGPSLPRHRRRGAHVLAEMLARLPVRHSWTHPEGWRDWPYETPATTVTSPREGANSREMCGGLRALRHTCDNGED